MGLLAAAGLDRVGVRPVPRVAVLVTGDELVDEGLPTASRPRDALGPALPGLLAGLGADAAHPTRVGDTVEELTRALRLALDVREPTAQVDLVLVTGASSLGPADHLHKALADLGAELLVDGVACRPGHPQLLARLPGGTPVCGLPGHPFAAVAAVMTLVAPILAVLDGRRPDPVTRCRWDGPRREHDVMLVPVRLIGGTPQPVGPSHSASLVAVAAATHLLVVPPGSDDPQMLRLPTGLVH
ncbi:molybdenum cofactor synthesis domain-containing protein [Friedmanniella endophytica]|uniref:Molybdopterin molybdenumtransferase n=1 Tax=Microlunatus kandeliicorticis TaxID=1759536 RepID=A0A7W3P4K5_9ACTN|nr:molybdenum cofactor synthesis domain-containing protein [Microlunatus kandeliicorticis]